MKSPKFRHYPPIPERRTERIPEKSKPAADQPIPHWRQEAGGRGKGQTRPQRWHPPPHCKQISLACVGSTHSVPATLGLPLLAACVLSLSTLLRLQVALQGAGPELQSMPKLLRFQFSGTPQKCRLGWACVLCLPCLSSSGSQELDECTLSGCRAPYPLRGPSLSFCT